MSPDMNITMAEALRLTRAGRLTEATAVLQRGLASAGTAGPHESTAAQPFADLGHFRLPVSNSRPEWPELPRADAASAAGLIEDSRPRCPAWQTSSARPLARRRTIA